MTLKQKKVVEIATVPGFTRGLDIVGDFAFIGVSKVRESATFGGLPITKLAKRVSGVWIVNIKTGKIVSFIEFTSGLDEVFAISVVPHTKMEMFDFDNEYSKSNYIISKEDIEIVKMPETKIERATPHFDKGNDLYNENKKIEAIEEYKKAIAIQNDHLPAIFNMSVALGDIGNFDEAFKMLQDVIDKDASILEAYDSMAFIYYKKGDLKSAKKLYEKILKLDEKNQKAKNSLETIKKELNAKS